MPNNMLDLKKGSDASRWQDKFAAPDWRDRLTALNPDEEAKFQEWAKSNGAPITDDYDMRGFWKNGGMGSGISPVDGRIHYPDTFKTPLHESFSGESIYARQDMPGPAWQGNRLVAEDGSVLFDEEKVVAERATPPSDRRAMGSRPEFYREPKPQVVDQDMQAMTDARMTARLGGGKTKLDEHEESFLGTLRSMFWNVGSGSAQIGEGAGSMMEYVGHRMEGQGYLVNEDGTRRQVPNMGTALVKGGRAVSNYFADARLAAEARSGVPSSIAHGNVIDNPELLARGSWWAAQLGKLAPSLMAAMTGAGSAGQAARSYGTLRGLAPEVIERLATVGAAMGGGLVGGALEGTSAYREALNAGVPEKEAAYAASVYAMASTALNAISMGKMITGKGAAGMAVAGLTEGATEGAEEPAQEMSSLLSHYVFTGEVPQDWKQRMTGAMARGATVFGPAAITGVFGSGAYQTMAQNVDPATGKAVGEAVPVQGVETSRRGALQVTQPEAWKTIQTAREQGVIDEPTARWAETFMANDPSLTVDTTFKAIDEVKLASAEALKAAGLPQEGGGFIAGESRTRGDERQGWETFITLYNGADALTLAHEIGHRYLDRMAPDARRVVEEAALIERPEIEGLTGSERETAIHEYYAESVEKSFMANLQKVSLASDPKRNVGQWLRESVARIMRIPGNKVSPSVQRLFLAPLTGDGTYWDRNAVERTSDAGSDIYTDTTKHAIRLFADNAQVDYPELVQRVAESQKIDDDMFFEFATRAEAAGASQETTNRALERLREYNAMVEQGPVVVLPPSAGKTAEVVLREAVLNTAALAGNEFDVRRRGRLKKLYEDIQAGKNKSAVGPLIEGGRGSVTIPKSIRGMEPRVFLNAPSIALTRERPANLDDFPMVITGNPHINKFYRPHKSWNKNIAAVRVKPVYNGNAQSQKAVADAINYANEIGAKVLVTTFRSKSLWVLNSFTDYLPRNPGDANFSRFWRPNPTPMNHDPRMEKDWSPYLPTEAGKAVFKENGWDTHKEIFGTGGTWWWPMGKELDPEILASVSPDTELDYFDAMNRECESCRTSQAAEYPKAAGSPTVGITNEPFSGEDASQYFVRLGRGGVGGRFGISPQQQGYGEADLGDMFADSIDIIQRVARDPQDTGMANWLSRFMISPAEDQADMVMALHLAGKTTADETARMMAEIDKAKSEGVERPQVRSDASLAGADINAPAQVEEAARLWQEMGTESPYFKRWADGRNVLRVFTGTTAGEAIRAEGFKPSPGLRSTGFLGGQRSVESGAFFFSPSRGLAGAFARNRAGEPGYGKNPEVLEVFIAMRNPFDLTRKTSGVVKLLEQAGFDFREEFGFKRGGEEVAKLRHWDRKVAEAEAALERNPDDEYEKGQVEWAKEVRDRVKKEAKPFLRASNYDFDASDLWVVADDKGVVNALKAMGYDGLIIGEKVAAKNLNIDDRGVSYAVFDPEQIKSVNNQGTFDANDPRIMYQVRAAAPSMWQSKVGRVLEASKTPEAMPGSEWSKLLTSKKWMGPEVEKGYRSGLINEEEYNLLGLPQFLAENAGSKLSRQDVLGYIEANTQWLDEEVLNGPKNDSEAVDARDLGEESPFYTRYDRNRFPELSFPNGNNYREMLVLFRMKSSEERDRYNAELVSYTEQERLYREKIQEASDRLISARAAVTEADMVADKAGESLRSAIEGGDQKAILRSIGVSKGRVSTYGRLIDIYVPASEYLKYLSPQVRASVEGEHDRRFAYLKAQSDAFGGEKRVTAQAHEYLSAKSMAESGGLLVEYEDGSGIYDGNAVAIIEAARENVAPGAYTSITLNKGFVHLRSEIDGVDQDALASVAGNELVAYRDALDAYKKAGAESKAAGDELRGIPRPTPPKEPTGVREGAVKNPHFDDFEDTVFHIRFNERVDTDGYKTLFIEEAQRDADENSGIPHSGNWARMAARRAIYWAAQRGFQRVAWTTGQQQIDRYQLSKVASRIQFDPVSKDLRAWGANGKVVFQQEVEQAALPTFIGAELSEKMLSQPAVDGAYELTGSEMKIGGGGKRTLYDKVLVSEFEKMVRPFGGKVGETQIDIADYSEMDYRKALDSDGELATVHSVDITPELARAITGSGITHYQVRPIEQELFEADELDRSTDLDYGLVDTEAGAWMDVEGRAEDVGAPGQRPAIPGDEGMELTDELPFNQDQRMNRLLRQYGMTRPQVRPHLLSDQVLESRLGGEFWDRHAGRVSLGNITSYEGLRASLASMADGIRSELTEAQSSRNLTSGEMDSLSNELGWSAAKIKRVWKESSGKVDFASVAALRVLNQRIASETMRLSGEIAAGGETVTPQSMASFLVLMDQVAMVDRMTTGGPQQGGHAIAVLKTLDKRPAKRAAQIDELLARYGGPAGVRQMTELVQQKAAGNDGKLATQDILNLMRKFRRPTWADFLFEIRTLGMLTNPITHVRNITENFIAIATAPTAKIAAAQLGRGFRLVRTATGLQWKVLSSGEGGEVAPGEASAYLRGLLTGHYDRDAVDADGKAYGFMRAQMEILQAAGKAFRTGEPQGGTEKLEQHYEPAVTGQFLQANTPGGDVLFGPGSPLRKAVDYLGVAIRTPSRALMAADEMFKAWNYKAELVSQAYRTAWWEMSQSDEQWGPRELAERIEEIIANPPDDMMDSAKAASDELTFTEDLQGYAKLLQQIARHPVGRLMVPFMRTPFNAFRFGNTFMPSAPADPRVRQAIKSGGAGRDLALARMMLGSMVLGTGTMLAALGFVTGDGPDDPKKRATWSAAGWKPRQFLVPGTKTQVSINGMGPLGMALRMGATLHERGKELNERDDIEAWPQMITPMAEAYARQLADNFWLESLLETMSAMLEDGPYRDKKVADMAASFVPFSGLGRYAKNLVDPVQRDYDGVVDAVKGMFPYLSAQAPAARDLFGYERSHDGYWGIDDIALPVKLSSTDAGSAAAQMMADNGVLRRMPGRTQTFKDLLIRNAPSVDVRLTAEQYSRFLELQGQTVMDRRGQTLEQAVMAKMNSAAFLRAGPIKRQSLVDEVFAGFQADARKQLYYEFPDVQRTVTQKTMSLMGGAR